MAWIGLTLTLIRGMRGGPRGRRRPARLGRFEGRRFEGRIGASVVGGARSCRHRRSWSLGPVAHRPAPPALERRWPRRSWCSRCSGTGCRRSPRGSPPRPRSRRPRDRRGRPSACPGVQMPHWAPPVTRNAAWSGSSATASPASLAGAASPSTVRIVAPSTWQIGTRQASTGAPSSEHRAGAALALAAALLGAGQGEVLAQDVEQAAHARDVDLGGGAVDGEPVRRHRAPAPRRAGEQRARRPGRRSARPGSAPGSPAGRRSRPRSHPRWPRPRPAPRRPSAARRSPWRRAGACGNGASTRIAWMRGASSAVGMRYVASRSLR